MPRFLVGRQAKVIVAGPSGPVKVGVYEEATANIDVELDSLDGADGVQYNESVGPRATVTLKRGMIDLSLPGLAIATANAGAAQNLKYTVIFTTTEGNMVTIKDCTISKWSATINKGIIKEDLEMKGEKVA